MWTELHNIEGLPTLLLDSPGIYGEWKRHKTANVKVHGIKVFDARLVATANTIEPDILASNADFRRYSEIAIVEPSSFVS